MTSFTGVLPLALLLLCVYGTSARNIAIKSPEIGATTPPIAQAQSGGTSPGGGGGGGGNSGNAKLRNKWQSKSRKNHNGRLCNPCANVNDCHTKLCERNVCVNRRKQAGGCLRHNRTKREAKKRSTCSRCSYWTPCKKGKCFDGLCASSKRTRLHCARHVRKHGHGYGHGRTHWKTNNSKEKNNKNNNNNNNRNRKRNTHQRAWKKYGDVAKCGACSSTKGCHTGLRCLRQRCADGWWARWRCPRHNPITHQVLNAASDGVTEYAGYANTSESDALTEVKSGAGVHAECEKCSHGFDCASGQCIRARCVSGRNYGKCFRNVRSSLEMNTDADVMHGDVIVIDDTSHEAVGHDDDDVGLLEEPIDLTHTAEHAGIEFDGSEAEFMEGEFDDGEFEEEEGKDE